MLPLVDERAGGAHGLARPGTAVDRNLEPTALFGQRAHGAALGGPHGELDLLARAQGERQRRREIERQLAHHQAGLDARLLADEEVIGKLGGKGLHAELHRWPPCLERHRRRPFGGDLDLGDAGLDRLQEEDVVARIELPLGRRAAHRRRLPALRIGVDEQRLEAELRRCAARLQAIGPGLFDLDEEGRGVEQVEAPRPAGDAGEPHGLAGNHFALALRAVPVADEDRGRLDRVGDRPGVHGRDPVLRVCRIRGARLELALPGASEMLQNVGLAGDAAHRDQYLVVVRRRGADLADRWHSLLGNAR